MPNFKYSLHDADGMPLSGVIEAATALDASNLLRGRGMVDAVTPLNAAEAILAKLRSVRVESGPGLKDVQAFTSQLSVMIKAGINIRTAIDNCVDQMENPKFRAVLQQVKGGVEAGQPFSDALARHPKVFSPLYVNMVRASELSGNFAHMLTRIASYLAGQIETRNMIRGAMVYPAIIAFTAVGTTIFLLTFVLPRFAAIFAGREDLLPKPTKILMGLSHAMRTYWYAFIGVAATVIGGSIYALRTPRGRYGFDIFKLRAPLLKRMFRALYITRGLHTMGELISAGVPVLETLGITAQVSGNILYKRMWENVAEAVRRGEKINLPLAKERLLPRSVVQMISAGEESGRLGEILQDVAEYYNSELKNTIKAVTSMIEPIMIMLMGFVVGFIAMSITLPIFKMSKLVK